ncbi:ATP-grasp domain-containing protein [Natronosporangium hydrolyticum]|uniref:ATP-grasp domain-containing protein n=1 Tax=Natronosporangium hydrolyticum TaxID=2811111 RepID=A0A895YFH0_9ACTN|nr:ATP-grasp domain-containing protein [Natronosporangium hydrolyticum]QSB16331.1 ATP-grasp domain-containing protein [Natronosporangium hydrolyticum]
MVRPQPPTGGGGELVVLVRDVGTNWVEHMSAVVHALGDRVAVVSGPDPVAGDRLASAADEVVIVADPTDPEPVTAAVTRLAAGRRPRAVLSITDGCVAVAAQAAEAVGLGRTPAAPIIRSRNKAEVRRRLRAAGLPGPAFQLFAAADEAAAVAAAVGLPAVVKPLNGTGSHLVRRVWDVAGLAAAYDEVTAGLASGPLAHLYQRPLPTAGGDPLDPGRVLLVERALVGREFCLDLVVRDGEVIEYPLVDKFLMDDHFFELGFCAPPFALDSSRQQLICAAAVAAVTALGVANTMAHVEVIDDQWLGPTVVEVNAGRPGGMGPAFLNRLTTGIDPAAELLAVHCGADRPVAAPRTLAPVAAVNVFAQGSGRVRAVHGLAELADHPDVLATVAAAEPGDVLTEQYEVDVAGLVLAGFTDRDELVRVCRELTAQVWAEFDPA